MIKKTFLILFFLILLLPLISYGACYTPSYNVQTSLSQYTAFVNDQIYFYGTTTISGGGFYTGELKEANKNLFIFTGDISKNGFYLSKAGFYAGSLKCCNPGQLLCPKENETKVDPQVYLSYWDSFAVYFCSDCNILYGVCCNSCIIGSELQYVYPTLTVISTAIKPLAPGQYQFNYKRMWVKRDSSTNYELCYNYTNDSITILTVKDKYTQKGGPSACLNCDIDFGDAVVDAGSVLGSEEGEIRIKGTLNLASKAIANKPIRIIFKKIILDGGTILLPAQHDGRAYFVKVGSQDPYTNAPAHICSAAYDSSRTTKYCGLRSLCNNGTCDSQAYDIFYY